MALLPARRYIRDDSFPVFLTPNDILQAFLPSTGPGSYPIPSTPPFIRNLLTSATTFFFSNAGNDNSGDGSSGNPWATLQGGFANLFKFFDLGAQTVTFQLADGTYAGCTLNGTWSGGGAVIINGNAVTPTNVVINAPTGSCLLNNVSQTGSITFTNLVLNSGGALGSISFQAPGLVQVNNVTFGSAFDAIVMAAPGAIFRPIGPPATGQQAVYFITAGASFTDAFFRSARAGLIDMNGLLLSALGNVTVGAAFAIGANEGLVLRNAAPVPSVAGAASGTQYRVSSNAIINVNGFGNGFFPGTAPTQPPQTGGQYL